MSLTWIITHTIISNHTFILDINIVHQSHQLHYPRTLHKENKTKLPYQSDISHPNFIFPWPCTRKSESSTLTSNFYRNNPGTYGNIRQGKRDYLEQSTPGPIGMSVSVPQEWGRPWARPKSMRGTRENAFFTHSQMVRRSPLVTPNLTTSTTPLQQDGAGENATSIT